jgi:hypothetical protein
MQIAYSVCRCPETMQSLFASPSFPSVLHAFLTCSSDAGILTTALSILQECFESVLDGFLELVAARNAALRAQLNVAMQRRLL